MAIYEMAKFQQQQSRATMIMSVVKLLTICSVLQLIALSARVVHSSGLGKHKASEEPDTSDYTNHVVAYEKDAIGFEKIEEFLQDHVKDEATEPNMQALKVMIREQLTRPMWESDPDLIDALKMFLNLDKLTDESTCNHFGYDFLIGLKKASRYRIDRRTTKRKRFVEPMRRIELLMSRFALAHAQKCKIVYQFNFARLLAEFDRSELKSIDAFMKVVIRDRAGGNSELDDLSEKAKVKRIYTSFIDKNDSFKKPKEAKLVLDFMLSMPNAADYSQLDEEARKRLVRTWFRQHMLNPCNHYSQTMSTDVFAPAQLDAQVMDKSDKIKPTTNEPRDGFIFGWARFGFCSMLERDQHYIIKNVVSLMDTNHDEEHANR